MPYFILMYSKSGSRTTLFYSSLYKGLIYSGYTTDATEGLSKTLDLFKRCDIVRRKSQPNWAVKDKIPMTLME